MLETTTLAGLHDYVVEGVLRRFASPGQMAIDLGTGSGALALRLRALGWNTRAADINERGYKADVPFAKVDLNDRGFAAQLGEGTFNLVSAVEVIEHIEHVESPIGFSGMWDDC